MNRKLAVMVGMAGFAIAALATTVGLVAILGTGDSTPAGGDGSAAPASSPGSASPTPCATQAGAGGEHDHNAPVPCAGTPEPGGTTFVAAANSWVDDFNRGSSLVQMGDGYDVFDAQGVGVDHSEHFRQNDHWMVDVDAHSGSYGGATMRPDQSFKFENGKLIIEAEAAAGIASYGGGAWVEIGVSTAPKPTGKVVDALYAYGLFGGQDSFGCRLQSSRVPTCALYAPDGDRTWEMSYFQHVAPNVFGGYPPDGADSPWRVCGDQDPDLNCRDDFRLELTKTSVTLFVNGQRYFEQSGADLFPDRLVKGDVYVYFSDWIYQPGNQRIRFHWDRIAINPPS